MASDFDSEFSTDEEMEAALDDTILQIAKIVEKAESRTSIINPAQIKTMSCVYKTMKRLVRGTGATVSYVLHEPFQSIGSVSVVGKEIPISDMNSFVRAARLASNFEAYPKTDGTVCITFTFHKLTIPIE